MELYCGMKIGEHEERPVVRFSYYHLLEYHIKPLPEMWIVGLPMSDSVHMFVNKVEYVALVWPHQMGR